MIKSLPSWECGLKSGQMSINDVIDQVAPFVGVWIEIENNTDNSKKNNGRSLRGSVD